MQKTYGYAAHTDHSPLVPFNFERRDPGPKDIQIEILFCGVCRADVQQARNEWGNSIYPMVPGHEIIGNVTGIGNEVTGFNMGDRVGVGCLVDSCRACPDCSDNLEQFCNEMTFTYNAPDKISGGSTYGGYSSQIVVDQHFVLHISDKLDPAAAAPLLCAGISTYSPLKHWRVGKGHKVGIVGLGGLGHMGVKFARAMGTHVVLFTTSANKIDDAIRLGAHEVVISTDPEAMQKHQLSFDFILNTVAAAHNLDSYTELLKRDGTLCLVGVPEHPHPSPAIGNLIFKRRQIAGSLIGGLKETQEMLDFCAEHNIGADIEIIPIQEINQAYERLVKGDVKYRFVIDLASLRTDAN
ncbi:MAG: NAD(P)-dependent alcohol dehydrogenase [Methylobacter sp.]